jgi:hypothetical protein
MTHQDFPLWGVIVVGIGAAAFLAPVVMTAVWMCEPCAAPSNVRMRLTDACGPNQSRTDRAR